MEYHNLKVVLGQLSQALPHILDGVNELESSAKEVKDLKAKKAEAETGYRQAHSERAQIIEAIENLKAQYAKLSVDAPAMYAEKIKGLDAEVLAAKAEAHRKIETVKASSAKAESEAAQRLAKAEAAANEAEARVKKAEVALAALKSA